MTDAPPPPGPLAQDPVAELGRKRYLIPLLAVFLAVAAWCSVNYNRHTPAGYDSGIFASGGFHLLRGSVLYRDIWDHKPPGAFLLNAMALGYGEGTLASVRRVEAGFLAVGAVLLFLTGVRLLRRITAPLLIAFLFILHISDPRVFEGGNLTEIYAAVFVLAGIFLCVLALETRREAQLACAAGSGLFFALAALTKEPFLLSALPWFLLLALARKRSWRLCLGRAACFIAGAALPAMAFFLYLKSNGALHDWLDTLEFGFRQASVTADAGSLFDRYLLNVRPAYENVLGQTWMGLTLLTLGGVALISAHRRLFVPLAAVAALFLDFTGTLISTRAAGHYYIQLLPSFALCCLCGVALLRDLFRPMGRYAYLVVAVFMAALIVVDDSAWAAFDRRCFVTPRDPQIGPMASYIRDNSRESDTVWAPTGDFSRCYLEAGRISPTRYYFIAPHLFVSTSRAGAAERIVELREKLLLRPPAYLMLTPSDGETFKLIGLDDWLRSEYRPLAVYEAPGGQLYKRRATANGGGVGAHR
jgi:hypothetical protein